MKYLVNRETKEHIRYHEDCSVPLPGWTVVEADDEGWIKWEAKSISKCPLPDDAKVEVLFSYDKKPTSNLLAGDWSWNDKMITHYRPILPAESKPDNNWLYQDDSIITTSDSADVFTRLSAAVSASESIPALIAEINALLPDGYEVREKAKTEAVTDDVQEFRVDDRVECVNADGVEQHLSVGAVYRVSKIMAGCIAVAGSDDAWLPDRFKLYSRPVTK